MDEEYEVVRAQLPGGGTVAVRALDLGGPADVGALDALKFQDIANTIRTIADTIGNAVKHSAPGHLCDQCW